MKFLIVLAAFVAVSSAQFGFAKQPFKPAFQASRTFAQAPAFPARTVAQAPAFQAARTVAQAPAFPARTVAQAPAFQAARTVAQAPVAVVASRASTSDQAANVLRYESDVSPDGTFNYVYETDNGVAASAQGSLRDFGGNPPVAGQVVQGSYSWTAPEGQTYTISYVADENGYQPSGDAIPTPPPVPAQILRALDWISKNPQKN